jgi:hypothetical protein
MTTQYQIPVTVTGSAGAATGTGVSTTPINGILTAVHIDYTSQPATADVTIAAGSPAQTVLAKADSGTDGWYYPQVQICGTDGAAISGQYIPPQLCGYVTVSVAQGDAGSVLVTLLVVEG